jgi:branched-chain amino acid transport system permease protein
VWAVGAFIQAGGPPPLFLVPLAAAGLLVGAVGWVVERGLLRFVYDRDETFQLLLTFALVLMLEDAIRLTWGTSPQSTGGLYLAYGQVRLAGATMPVYNLIVIGASLAIALGIGWLLTPHRVRPHHPGHRRQPRDGGGAGREHGRVYAKVFTLGTALGTLGGALVIPPPPP